MSDAGTTKIGAVPGVAVQDAEDEGVPSMKRLRMSESGREAPRQCEENVCATNGVEGREDSAGAGNGNDAVDSVDQESMTE